MLSKSPHFMSRESPASIASATKGMRWLVFAQNPRSRKKTWVLRRDSVSYVDAFMERHSVVNEGLVLMFMVSDEPADVWLGRLNGITPH